MIKLPENFLTRLIFWMNIPSFYQGDLFRALSGVEGIDLNVYFSGRLPADRLSLGWQDDLSGFHCEFIDGKLKVTDAIWKALSQTNSVHVVGGLWAGRMQEAVLATLAAAGSKYFIYSEAPEPGSVVPGLRSSLLVSLGKPLVRKASGLLAISHFARDYFISLGADRSKVLPFGYFRSFPPGFRKSGRTGEDSGVDAIYVGQLVHRKGIDVLLEAARPLFAAHGGFRLHLVGSGDKENEYKKWVADNGLSDRVRFEGAMASAAVMERISKADVLILPSRWDGWGLVVNEALMAGVPVIVSDMCGAADLVSNGVNGYTFRSGDVADLRAKLQSVVGRKVSESLSIKAEETGVNLSAENAAKYLVEILVGNGAPQHERAQFPWVLPDP